MASCSGCGLVLGFKKYKFKKLWRIGGSYCKPCMMEIGKNWEDHGRVTLYQCVHATCAKLNFIF